MSRNCSLIDCKSSLSSVGVKLFKLSEERSSLWKKAIQNHRIDGKNVKLICNKHFEKKYLGKKTTLKKGAVPTLFNYRGLQVNTVKNI